MGLSANQKASGDKLDLSVPFVVNKANGEVIDINFQAWKSGPRAVKFRYDLSAAKDVPVTLVTASLGVEKAFSKGEWVLRHTDGKTSTQKLPVGITSRPAASKAVLRLEKAGDIAISFDPPCGMAFDKDLRVLLAQAMFKAGSRTVTLTVALPNEVSFIELQNEDNIFFYTNENAFSACPTYTQHFVARFCDWLKARYGSEENLKKAWGDALKSGESLAAKNIVPPANPWFFGEDNLPKQTGGVRRRLLDTTQHFHELQNRFYGRFVKAIRDAGYQGALCGSPWQAPSMLPHYLNLRSVALVGFIDRHNYFGASLFDTLLTKPGGGYVYPPRPWRQAGWSSSSRTNRSPAPFPT